MTDHRDEHEPYGFTESPVIARLHTEIARLTAERDEARSAWGQATWDRSKSEESHRAWISDMKKLRDQAIEDYRRLSTRLAEYQREWTRQEERFIFERDQAVRERNEARRDAERWQADALRLLNERNAAQGERDEARRMVCNLESRLDWQHGNIDPARFSPMAIAEQRGWVCFKEGTK